MSERTVLQRSKKQPSGTAVLMCSIHRNTPFRSSSRNCSSVGWAVRFSLGSSISFTAAREPDAREPERLMIHCSTLTQGRRLKVQASNQSRCPILESHRGTHAMRISTDTYLMY